MLARSSGQLGDGLARQTSNVNFPFEGWISTSERGHVGQYHAAVFESVVLREIKGTHQMGKNGIGITSGRIILGTGELGGSESEKTDQRKTTEKKKKSSETEVLSSLSSPKISGCR